MQSLSSFKCTFSSILRSVSCISKIMVRLLFQRSKRHRVFFTFICLISLVLFYNRSRSKDYVLFELLPHLPTEFTIHEKIQLERMNLIKEECKIILARETKRNSSRVRFTVLERNQIMYCDVPKVASTNLKKLMLVLSDLVETDDLATIPGSFVHVGNQMRKLEANSRTEINRHGLGNFTKFLFVRHPFERLVSAYKDKLTSNNTYYNIFVGKLIVRRYRKQPNQLSLENGHDVTFPEFVNFIVDEWKDGMRTLDVHWRPIADLCLPCVMEYNFIGKFETLNQDVDFLLKSLNESNHSRLFKFKKPVTSLSLWKQLMENISRQHLSDLNSIFGDDFRIFGYPEYTGKE